MIGLHFGNAACPQDFLHAPAPDEALLDGFVEQCSNDGVSLVAVVGRGCGRMEDIIDDIAVGNGNDGSRFLCTTSHPAEPFDDVLNMAMTGEFERGDPVEEVPLSESPSPTTGFNSRPVLIQHRHEPIRRD